MLARICNPCPSVILIFGTDCKSAPAIRMVQIRASDFRNNLFIL
jgi:hypothetical protein